MTEPTDTPTDPPAEEWHPVTRKDYEDIMAGGIIRARELEEAEKAKGGDPGGSGGPSGSDDEPPKRRGRNFLGGGS